MCPRCMPPSPKEIWMAFTEFNWLALMFSRFPFITLFLAFLLSFLASWSGVSRNGFPEFDNPYLGFKTRRTSLSDRITTLSNLRTEFKSLRIIENFPGERMSSVEFRRRRSANGKIDYCMKYPDEENSRIALEINAKYDLLSPEVVGRMCYFQTLVEDIFDYKELCEKDGHRDCCPSWSLPNYIALHANKPTCKDIKDEDISKFRADLLCCLEIMRREANVTDSKIDLNQHTPQSTSCNLSLGNSSQVPQFCQPRSPVKQALRYSLEKYFGRPWVNGSNISSPTPKKEDALYSMIILPIPKNPRTSFFMDDFTQSVIDIYLPDNVVRMGGFNFGTKDKVFEQLLVSDLRYVIVASVLIFIIICVYTKSIFITIISFGTLTLSLGVSYFLYNDVFKIPYFPFMNMLVTIIVLGIGTDGTLILSVAWRRLRNHFRDEPFNKQLKYILMKETLKETTPTLVITTLTTACCFYASLTSSIITIRCFSIFAGTSIIVSFVFLYFTVPTALLASDILLFHTKSAFADTEKNSWLSQLVALVNKSHEWKTWCTQFLCPVKTSLVIHRLTATRVAILPLITFTGFLIWGCVVVFYHPGFELPQTEQFQLLTYNHPIEKFDREIEPQFDPEDAGSYLYDNITFYFVWGIKAVDNGESLNPRDEGYLEFDREFNLSLQASQLWMHSFCKHLKNQSFYDLESNMATGANFDSCMLDTMINWMDRDCKPNISFVSNYEPCCSISKFPYEPDVFTKCVPIANRHVYRTPVNFFQPDVAGPKFYTTFANPQANEEQDKPAVLDEFEARRPPPDYSRMGDLATFTVRARTNFFYSLSFDKMSHYYQTVHKFFNESIHSAPAGVRNGFFISSHYDFYDLQYSLLNDTWHSLLLSTGLCFIFIWISSRSFLVSTGAVISILAIVIVSSAILIQLFSWKLGVFESIAVTVAVGLSDFTTHHSIEFAKRESISMMTSATFFSALATIIMGLSMFLFSQVLVYQQIGAFFFVLVLTSWLYSVFFLSPLLLLFNILWRYLAKEMLKTFGFLLEKLPCSHQKNNSVCSSATNKSCENCSEKPCGCDSADEAHPTICEGDEEGSNLTRKKQTVMLEKLKLLKRISQETTV